MQTMERARSRPEVTADRKAAAAEARAGRAEAMADQRVEVARKERDAGRAELVDMREDRDRWRVQAERLAGALEKLRAPASAPDALPESSESADLLYGLKAIAEHLGLTVDQAKHRAASGQIPTFKMGGTVCGRRLILAASLNNLGGR